MTLTVSLYTAYSVIFEFHELQNIFKLDFLLRETKRKRYEKEKKIAKIISKDFWKKID